MQKYLQYALPVLTVGKLTYYIHKKTFLWGYKNYFPYTMVRSLEN